jgi:hypothetical protein
MLGMIQASGMALRPMDWTMYVLKQVMRITDAKIGSLVQEPPEPEGDPAAGDAGGGASPAPSSDSPVRSVVKSIAKKNVRKKLQQELQDGNGGDLPDREVALLVDAITNSPSIRRQMERVNVLFEGDVTDAKTNGHA